MAQDRLGEGALLFPGMPTPPQGGATAGGYRIRRAIDSGGFGITYEAVKQAGGDPDADVTANLWLPPEQPIVIKEFFPDFASRRGRSITVEGEDDSHEETFNHALRRFQREAERLCHLTCRRALRSARPMLDAGDPLGPKIDRELAASNSDPSRAMVLVGRLTGAARDAARQALSRSTLPIVYDFFAADNNAYYVMEFLGGGTLKGRLNEDRRNSGTVRVDVAGSSYQLRRPWEPDRLRRFAAAALNALEELHNGIPGQQLVHCDLKPGNIMFRANDSDDPVLIDFGLARNVNDGKSRSLVAGTLGFAPLEIDPHLRAQYGDDRFGGANVGPWTDIYSMAAILRMLATGVEGSRLPSVFERMRTPAGELDPVDKLPPFPEDFPGQMARAIMHGMGLYKQDRPQSIDEWRHELGLNGGLPPAVATTVAAPSARGGGWALESDSVPSQPTQPPRPPVGLDKVEAETLLDRSSPSSRSQAPYQAPPQPQPFYGQPSPPAPPPEQRWAPPPPAVPPPPDRRPHDSYPPDGRQSIDLGGVIQGTINTITGHAGSMLLFAFLLGGLPAAIFSLFSSAGGSTSSTSGAAVLFGFFIVMPLYLAAAIMLQAIVTRIAIEGAGGQRTPVGDLFSGALAILFPLLGLMVLMSLAIALGLVLLIVPGVILICMWAVAAPALIAERSSVTAALDRSRRLTEGVRWPIFGLLLIYVVGIIVLQIPSALVTQAGLGWAAAFVINMIVSTITGLVFPTLMAVLYVELRRVKEGAGPGAFAEIFR